MQSHGTYSRLKADGKNRSQAAIHESVVPHSDAIIDARIHQIHPAHLAAQAVGLAASFPTSLSEQAGALLNRSRDGTLRYCEGGRGI